MSAFEFMHHHVWKVNRDGDIQCDECDYILDPEAVINDIETAQRRYAAAMEIVQVMAAWNDADYRRCQFCFGAFDYDALPEEERFNHAPDCPVIRARALLASVEA